MTAMLLHSNPTLGTCPTTRTSDRTWTGKNRGEPALRLQHRRARLRARGRISPLVAFAAAEVSGTDRSRRPEHAPNRSSALVRGMRLAASGCRLRDGKCFGFPIV